MFPAAAETSIGISGGVPLNHFILDSSNGGRFGFSQVTSAPRRYTIGPTIDAGIAGPVSLDLSVMYKRWGFDTFAVSGFPLGPRTSVISRTTGNSWEFPVLGKLRLRAFEGADVFVALGPSIRHLTGIRETGVRTVTTTVPPPGSTESAQYTTDSPAGMDRRTAFGVAFAAGLRMRMGALRLEPEFRITRWDSERTSSGPSPSRIERTQAEVLLNIRYAVGGPEATPARLRCCLEIGVLGGVPLRGATQVLHLESDPFATWETRDGRWVAGALLGWPFHPRLAVEASFLVRRAGHAWTRTFPDAVFRQTYSAYSWEATLLLRYYAARVGPAELYGAGGAALRTGCCGEWISYGPGGTFSLSSWFRNSWGGTAAGGLEFRAGATRIRPELRYSRFATPLYDLYTARTRPDSLNLVIGLAWSQTGATSRPTRR